MKATQQSKRGDRTTCEEGDVALSIQVMAPAAEPVAAATKGEDEAECGSDAFVTGHGKPKSQQCASGGAIVPRPVVILAAVIALLCVGFLLVSLLVSMYFGCC